MKHQPLTQQRRWRWYVAALYAALLLLAHVARALTATSPALPADEQAVTVPAVDGEARTAQPVRVAYRAWGDPRQPVVVLLHGSPGSSGVFAQAAPSLAQHYRVIAPDLPGFGASTAALPDYAIRAHARYVLALLDALHVPRAHIVGFSLGGGVALNIADLAPERVQSLTLLSATGVQEFELLGDYALNHTVHGAQLAGLWLLHEAVPHFGLLDHTPLNVSYARNFYDSDQRPLRGILERYAGPLLIIHGARDPLVPVAAAREHHRLVPQSELVLLNDDHFMIFQKGAQMAQTIMPFLDRAQAGTATTRATADPARIVQAAAPFDAAHLPPFVGIAALVAALLLVGATFVSEDLACIGAGMLVAHGRLDFLTATGACFVGIVLGDLLIFLAGRWLGQAALGRAPLKWLVRAQSVAQRQAWFARRGATVIMTSRFLPGVRVPTYVAAGVFGVGIGRFLLYLSLAAAVWTPLLVGFATLLSQQATMMMTMLNTQDVLVQTIVVGALLLIVLKLVVSLATYRGRRLLLGAWRRNVRWEFWSLWRFYPPVVAYMLWLAWKYRSLTLFTAANPGMPNGGGVVGESKAAILRGLAGAGDAVARWVCIAVAGAPDERVGQAQRFMREHDLRYPVVLKPDVGERGAGVAVVRSDAALAAYLRAATEDTIIQAYVPGVEFGVFYTRLPGAAHGAIFAITDKRFPVVIGDGVHTLEHLILADERAICMAQLYMDAQGERLWAVPATDERVQLVELGTHSKGAIFLDGAWAKTPALEAAIERVSQHFDGFYFGRYDVRAASAEAFQRGEFQVLELNGVTSEATSIYDPTNSVFAAYRVLFAQWRLAFAIGAANRARGAVPLTLAGLLRLLVVRRRAAPRSAHGGDQEHAPVA